jgi:hypothetical protein
MQLHKIEKKVFDLSKKWVGEKHIPSMIRSLNKTFKRNIVCFSSERFEGEYYDDHNVIVHAHYCNRISDFIPEHIFIELHFPVGLKKVTITENGAWNLAIRIIRAIHHEYRHKYQQRQRPLLLQKEYKPKPKQNKMKAMYYGNPDELDAHAYETQAEHLDINKLRKAHKIGWRHSEAIFMYRQTFRKQDPKVWKKFLKKVYKNNGRTDSNTRVSSSTVLRSC